MHLLNLTNDYRCSLSGCKQHICLCTAASRQPCSEWIKTARKAVWKLPCQSLHYTIKGLFLSLSNNCQGTQRREKKCKGSGSTAMCSLSGRWGHCGAYRQLWLYLFVLLAHIWVSDVNKPRSLTIKLVQRWAFISIGLTISQLNRWRKKKLMYNRGILAISSNKNIIIINTNNKEKWTEHTCIYYIYIHIERERDVCFWFIYPYYYSF